MGNSQTNERNQTLLQRGGNQIADQDVSLLVTDQPQIKKIFAIKNPVFLKRNSLVLERDSESRNLFYIKFNYDAVVDLNLNIIFLAGKKTRSEKSINVQRLQVSQNSLSSQNGYSSYYMPSSNVEQNILSFGNLPNGQNASFFDRRACIDINIFNSLKENNLNEETYDLVIEFVPIFREGNQNENEILFYTICKITNEDNTIKIKTEVQRLRSQGMWFDLHEVFNSALETGECLICCSNNRNTIFLPCKHSCCCHNCSHSLRMRNSPCPICKIAIDDLIIVETDEDQNLGNTLPL